MTTARRNTTRRDKHRRALAKGEPPCHWCGTELDYEADADWLSPTAFQIDHIIPLSAGGPDTLANLVASCRRCNRAKSARLPGDPTRYVYVTPRHWKA